MNFWFHIVNIGLIISVLGFSLNLLIGYTGLVSMAHGAIYGLGAYAAAITSTELGVPFPLTIVIAVLVAGALSLLTAWPALRVKGEYLILLTLAVQTVATGIFVAWVEVTGGSSGIAGIDRPELFGVRLVDPPQFLPLLAVVFALAFAVAYWVGHSPFGRALNAVRENESATLAVGKSVTYYKVAVFGVSGLLAGLAGGTFAHYQAFVNPTSFNLDASIFLVAVIVLGGAGNLFGTVVGAALLASLPQVLTFLELGSRFVGVIQKFLYGALLVLFMIYRPQGLIPQHARLFRRHGAQTADGEAAVGHQPSGSERPVGGPSETVEEPAEPPEPHDKALPDQRERRGGEQARPGDEALRADDLHKSFGGVKPADGLSLVLPSGRVTALVGPNGAGKTTVFNLLTGFIAPDAGTVVVRGQRVDSLAPWQRVHRGLARSFQDVRLFQDLRVLDNVLVAIPGQEGENLGTLFGKPLTVRRRAPEQRERALAYLDFVGMRSRADDLASSLAYGEQKLVSMARLAATEADILLLDEPASGVDRQWVERILALIAALAGRGKTICIVEHNLDVVRAVADRAYFMDQGRILAEGTPDELMADDDLATRYFGARRGPEDRADAQA